MVKRLLLITMALCAVVYTPLYAIAVTAVTSDLEQPEAVERLVSESLVPPKVRLFDKGTRVRELIGRFPLAKTDRPDDALYGFLERHRAAFGLSDPRAELVKARVEKTDGGDRHVFQQESGGYGVWGNTLEMTVDSDGVLVIIVNRTGPVKPVEEKPAIKRSDAISAAATEWKRQRGADMPDCASELLIYDDALAYDVKVPDAAAVYHIMVDAMDGRLVRILRVEHDKSEACH